MQPMGSLIELFQLEAPFFNTKSKSEPYYSNMNKSLLKVSV